MGSSVSMWKWNISTHGIHFIRLGEFWRWTVIMRGSFSLELAGDSLGSLAGSESKVHGSESSV